MIDNSKEYILCAAVMRRVPREENSYHKGLNDIHKIEIGYRHHDIYQRFNDRRLYPNIEDCPLRMTNSGQGFYTSKGRYVDRYEGMKIAYECGQVTDKSLVFKSQLKNIEVNFIGEIINDPDDVDSEYSKIYRPLFSEDLY